jgi:hypothetical protein
MVDVAEEQSRANSEAIFQSVEGQGCNQCVED